jgi:hypothetical protein
MDKTLGCADYNSDTTKSFNAGFCAMITKENEYCFYDSVNNTCGKQTTVINGCEGVGFNIWSCGSMTNGNCYWDSTNHLCKLAGADTDYSQFKCTDTVGKSICLKITSYSCYWD